jgi:hypothetical protein
MRRRRRSRSVVSTIAIPSVAVAIVLRISGCLALIAHPAAPPVIARGPAGSIG